MPRKLSLVALFAAAGLGCCWSWWANRSAIARSPLPVELAGCAALLADGTCAIAEDRSTSLRAWIALPAAQNAEWSLAGRALDPLRESIQGGVRFTIELTAGAELGALSVRSGVSEYRVRLVRDPALAVLREAEAMSARGALEEAAAHLGALSAAEDQPEVASRAAGLRARIELRRGRLAEARKAFEVAIALDRAAGRRSAELLDLLALAFLLIAREQEFSAARAVIDRAMPLAKADPEGASHTAYTLGLLAVETGDYQTALLEQQEAEARAERLGIASVAIAASEQQAIILQSLGRADEAAQLLDVLEAKLPASDECRRARLRINSGWVAYLRAEAASEPPPPSVRERFAYALEMMQERCHDRTVEAIALVDLAMESTLRGARAEAERDLAAVELIEGELNSSLRLEVHGLRGRVALLSGRAEAALVEMDRWASFADLFGDPEARWRAELGRGDALAALDRDEEALRAYRAAEELLDRQGLRFTLSAGRSTFFGDRGQSAARLIALYLDLGRPAEACAAARYSSLRALRELERHGSVHGLSAEQRLRWDAAVAAYRQRRRELDQSPEVWSYAGDQLRALVAQRSAADAAVSLSLERALIDRATAVMTLPPAERAQGELTIALYPIEQDWLICTSGQEGIAAQRITGLPADPRAAAVALLETQRHRLANAREVHLSASGALRGVDLHALELDGRPLSDRVPVSYTLDLAAADQGSKVADEVVIVADPTSDLLSADQEGTWLAQHLDRSAPGWSVRVLRGAAASGEDVRAALTHARLLHVAGHGHFGGLGGSRAALLLAGGARLTVGDVLTLERVPEIVVLAGCKTGQTDPSAPIETLGLAQAFLLNGSRAVVAAVRLVDDQLAAAITRELYAGGVEALIADPALALAAAQRRLRALDPAADWAAFRVFSR